MIIVKKKNKDLCQAYRCKNKRVKWRTLCPRHKAIRQKECNPISYTYSHIKNSAKRRGIEFTLTVQEFREFCEETNYIELKGKKSDKMSLDGIDNNGVILKAILEYHHFL